MYESTHSLSFYLTGYTNIHNFVFCIRITKNYIIDTTDTSQGSQANCFSEELNKYLQDYKKPVHIIKPKNTPIITSFEKKVSLILLQIFISNARITLLTYKIDQVLFCRVYEKVFEISTYTQK